MFILKIHFFAFAKETPNYINMAFELTHTVDTIEIMENYIQRNRPPEHIRKKLDISYRIENQSIFLSEIRPMFMNPAEKIQLDYAKTIYVKKTNKWKVYWMGANLKWYPYPKPEVNSLKAFLKFVDKDEYHYFKG